MATLDEVTAGEVETGATEAIVTEAGGKPRRRSIFARRQEATEDPQPVRVVLAQNVFGRVTEEIEVEDKTAAAHWDIRCWWPLR